MLVVDAWDEDEEDVEVRGRADPCRADAGGNEEEEEEFKVNLGEGRWEGDREGGQEGPVHQRPSLPIRGVV